MSVFVKEWLRKAGVRPTKAREAALTILFLRARPMTLKQVHAGMKGMNLVTAYRAVESLARFNLARRVLVGGRSRLFEAAPPNGLHHDHVTCQRCRRLVCLDVCAVERIVRHVSRSTGFSIRDHSLTFSGLCPACRRVRTARNAGRR